MDSRAVIPFLWLLIAQAACGPIGPTGPAESGNKTDAVRDTIQEMRGDIRTALNHLAAPGLLPKVSCLSQYSEKLTELRRQNLTAHQLSLFGCYMVKVSGQTPELSSELKKISQKTQHVYDQAAHQDCSLPTFEQDMDSYVFVKCLLELLDQQLQLSKV